MIPSKSIVKKQDGTGGGGGVEIIYICQWDKVYRTTQRGKERKKEKFDI